MDKIVASTYSFTRLIDNGSLTQIECLSKAKEMGFEGIEIVDIRPHDGRSEMKYAELLAEEAKRIKLPIVNYTIGADFLTGSDGDTKAEIERVKRQIDIAAILGAKGVRHDATNGYGEGRGFKSFNSVLPILVKACGEITKYASTLGIRTMVENHGFFCQDSDRMEKLITEVNHENFGWLVDIGNFLCTDENPAIAVGRAAPYAFYVHAKDFYVKSGREDNPGEGFFLTRGGNYLRGAILGHGGVPVAQCLAALHRGGYRGDIAIEFEGMEDTLTGISISLANLKRYIAELKV